MTMSSMFIGEPDPRDIGVAGRAVRGGGGGMSGGDGACGGD